MGRLVVLEGLDGSGKATQTARLCRALQKAGCAYRHISFPDYNQPSSALVKLYLSGAFGGRPADVNPYAASSFYAVDRYASFRQFWQADYASGRCIVADRYTTSNLVYQQAKLPRAQWPAFMEWVADYEYRRLGLPEPDVVLFLDMPPATAQQLMAKRYHGDRAREDIHERDIAYQDACRQAALYAAGALGWRVIPCAQGQNALPVETIADAVLAAVRESLPALF